MPNALYELIAREAAQRPLSIGRYMEWALQHPELGYYRKHDPLGRGGDFITAPEISQMFGELIGLWCADLWWQIGKPKPFALVELGPGRGTLLADALRAAGKQADFLAALDMHLLESNADFKAQQMETLGRYRPRWLDDLDALPPMPTIIIANEFFDALPVRQLVRQETGWQERCIGALDGKLGWVTVPAEPGLVQQLSAEQKALPVGATAEIAPQARAMMAACARHIATHNGALLTFDYGYELPPGVPTFQALARHEHTDPLLAPGEADLTAHVDFIALEWAATEAGAQPWQVQEQGWFLDSLGLPQRAAQLAARTDAAGKQAVAAACARLTGDEAMGKLFKVLCVTRNDAVVPAGWMLE